MTAIKESLINARNLIAATEHWTQGDHAITNTGAPVDPLSDDAYAFCADGACARVANGFSSSVYADMIRALDESTARLFGFYDQWAVVRVNDCEIGDFVDAEMETAHKAVIDIFNDAIEHASQW